jgi:predicted GNAT family N-acyltransferase
LRLTRRWPLQRKKQNPCAALEERKLDTEQHKRSGFACGVPELDDYLQRYASQQVSKGVSAVNELVDTRMPFEILGYYTLSAAQIDAAELSLIHQTALPKYPVPCFRMSRLASHIDQRGKGVCRLLLACAVERCLAAKKQVAAFALIVDAKDEAAQSFYAHYGFKAFAGVPLSMYLPLGG